MLKPPRSAICTISSVCRCTASMSMDSSMRSRLIASWNFIVMPSQILPCSKSILQRATNWLPSGSSDVFIQTVFGRV